MSNLFITLGSIAFICFIIGLFNPKLSLFFVKDKEKRTRKKSNTIYLIAWIVCGIIGAASGGSSSGSNSSSDNSVAVNKEWKELIAFSGNGNKKSATFVYSGGNAKLKYNFEANQLGAFAIYVVPKGKDIMKDGALPEVMISNSENSESNLSHLSKGEYYISIISANGTWEVSVEELK